MRLMVWFNKMTMIDIFFDSTEDEDFRGFSFNMELYQMVIMNVWEVNQGGARCGEVMSALLAFF